MAEYNIPENELVHVFVSASVRSHQEDASTHLELKVQKFRKQALGMVPTALEDEPLHLVFQNLGHLEAFSAGLSDWIAIQRKSQQQ